MSPARLQNMNVIAGGQRENKQENSSTHMACRPCGVSGRRGWSAGRSVHSSARGAAARSATRARPADLAGAAQTAQISRHDRSWNGAGSGAAARLPPDSTDDSPAAGPLRTRAALPVKRGVFFL